MTKHEMRAGLLEALVSFGVELPRAERIVAVVERIAARGDLLELTELMGWKVQGLIPTPPAPPGDKWRQWHIGVVADLQRVSENVLWLVEQLHTEITPELAETVTEAVRALMRADSELLGVLDRRRTARNRTSGNFYTPRPAVSDD